jgi:2-oxoglutarate ferredoxin oxidoreductase subunit alpha
MDKMGQAYAIAEKYRNPVMLLVDGMLGQMMEPVSIPERLSDERIDAIRKTKTWAVTGHGQARRKNVIKSLRLKPEELEASIEERGAKYADAEKNLVEFDATSLDRAEVVFVAFGSTSRIVKEAMGMLDGAGVKCGMIRPISLWPFPYKAFDLLAEETRLVVSVELSMGQMIQDVKLGVLGRKPVELMYRTGGSLLTPEDVVSGTKNMLEGY